MNTVTVKQVVKYKGKYFKLVEGTTNTPSLCTGCIFGYPSPPALTDGCNTLGGNCGNGIFKRATEKDYLLAKLQGVGS